MTIQKASLFFNDLAKGGTSDKEYHAQVMRCEGGFKVNFQYGRRGGTLQVGTKTPAPVMLNEAIKIFQKLVNEKVKGGYQLSANPKETSMTETPVQSAVRTRFPIEDLDEIEEPQVAPFLTRDDYWLQLKVDGEYRQIEKRANGTYVGFNKEGNAVGAIPTEVLYELKKIEAKSFFMVGEQVGTTFTAYNLYEFDGEDLTKRPHKERHEKLESLIPANSRHVIMIVTWKTREQKIAGLKALHENRCEGAVFVKWNAPYRAGKSRVHKKFKFVKSLSAIVVGIGHKGHNSATLGLIDATLEKVIEVGRCSLNGKPTVKVGWVVEVLYLYATSGRRLYQPRMKCVRTDVPQSACTVKQMIFKQGVAA